MTRRLIAAPIITAGLVLTLLLSACMFDADIEDVALYVTDQAIGFDSDDHLAEAAWDVGSYANRISAADLAFHTDLIKKDPAAADRAIAARPRDPQYRLYKAAIEVATGGNGVETAAGQALGLIAMNHPGLSDSGQERVFVDGFLYTLSDMAGYYDRGSPEWNRLLKQYCFTYKAYEKAYQLSNYPHEAC